MKKILLLLAIFSVLLMSFNCEADDEASTAAGEPSLVTKDCLYGSWEKTETNDDGTSVTTFAFAEDNTLVRTKVKTKDSASSYSYEKGTWLLNDNILEIIIKTNGYSETSAAEALASAADNGEDSWYKQTSRAACKGDIFSDETFLGGNTETLIGNWTSGTSKSYKMYEGDWKVSEERVGSLEIIKDGKATYTGTETAYYGDLSPDDDTDNTEGWFDTPQAKEEKMEFTSWTYADGTLTITSAEGSRDMSVIAIGDYIGIGAYEKQ